MQSETTRTWLVRWMYATALVHLLVGILLPWIGNLSVFDPYHRSIEAFFWSGAAPAAARAQQVWWISLFAPTVQGLSLWMIALIRIGERYRITCAWLGLILGLIAWAPQDMWLSLRADAWVHVWVDCFALVTMLPPLWWLWRFDSKVAANKSN